MTNTQNTKTDFRIAKLAAALSAAANDERTAERGGDAYWGADFYLARAARWTTHAAWIAAKIRDFPAGVAA